ncbi:hypothetical protein LWI29_007350 [Acer saccharum]|uniref:Uncharacterized protein n=1 Tax=Acer saccharum TaxID=4024 RepID=A0AA39VDS9_ACESA|nr:hypothetical protein LWI29_007350 [Acer saccharum]
MEAAAIMAIALAHGGVSLYESHLTTSWISLIYQVFRCSNHDVLSGDHGLSFIEENNAGKAAAALMARLPQKPRTETNNLMVVFKAQAGIKEIHFLPLNQTDKRTALSYLDFAGKVQRVSKGAPEQILDMAHNKSELSRGYTQSSTMRIFAGDQLAIGKETGRRLGMGTNMYPSSALLGVSKDETSSALPFDDLIEKADGVAGVHTSLIDFSTQFSDFIFSISIT